MSFHSRIFCADEYLDLMFILQYVFRPLNHAEVQLSPTTQQDSTDDC